MAKCQICLHEFNQLRFKSLRISVCGGCVNSLNESPEVAEHAERRIGDLLHRGLERRALQDREFGKLWQKQKAERTLSNIDAAYAAALPAWLNKLLADPKNTKKDFKYLRAHRRGLLHYNRPSGWGYPKNWKEVASRIRQLDGYRCVVCAADNRTIDVHHIVYVSNFGTHQQTNLVSLCRPCHESEHNRSFDFGEGENKSHVELPVTVAGIHLVSGAVVVKSPTPEICKAVSVLELGRDADLKSRLAPSTQLTEPQVSTKMVFLAANTERIATDPKFCGSCRTLVYPRRLLFFFKRCPNCLSRI